MPINIEKKSAESVTSPSTGSSVIFVDLDGLISVKQSNGTTNSILPVTSSNTQLVYNNQGNLVGSSDLTFNGDELSLNGNLVVVGNTNLGAVGNIRITGGSNGYVLTTNGSGNLRWVAQTTNQPTTVTVDSFTGNGVQTQYTLSVTPTDVNYVFLAIGGVSQPRSAYSLSGNVVTVSSPPPNQAIVEFTTITGTSGGGGGNAEPGGSNTQVQFNDDGAFNGDAGFTFDKTTGVLSVPDVSLSGNIIPTSNVVYSLGNNTNRFNNLYLAGNTIVLGGATISANATGITFTSPEGGNFSVVGSGDSNTSAISNGNSNVIVSANSNISISAAGNANILVVTGTGSNISGTLSVSGNSNVGNLGTSGQIISTRATGTAPFVVTSTTQVANLNVATAGSATTAGTVTTAAQPNITSVGTLTSLNASGNITTTNTFVATANLTIAANGESRFWYQTSYTDPDVGVARAIKVGANGIAVLGGIKTDTLNTTGNANVGNIGAAIGAFTSNVSANNLTTTNKITAGNGFQVTTGGIALLSGNLDVTGNVNVTGNLNYSNVTELVIGDPLIYLGANNTGDVVDLGIVASYNNGNYFHTGLARNAGDDYWTFFDGVVAEPTTRIDWANATYPTVKLGNLIATGTANITGNIAGGNVYANSGTIRANLLTGTITTSAQPNITSVGTLTSLNVNGTVTAVAFTANTGVFTGNGSGLTQLTGANVSGEVSFAATANAVAGANVSGQVSNALVAGTVYTAAQPNITSVGTLSGLTSTGVINFTGTSNVSLGSVSNLKITGGTSGYFLQTDGAGNLLWAASGGGGGGNGTPGGANTQVQFNDAGSFGGTAGFTFNKTSNTLSVSGIISGGFLVENSLTVSANYTITSGKSAMSVGPLNIASGVSVTVPAGSKWVIL